MTRKTAKRILCVALIFLVPVVFLAWYQYPTTTVPEVQKRLSEEIPLGTPRAKAEAWIKDQGIEHSYSQDFQSTVMEENGIRPEDYSGFIVAIIRDTDRDLFVTGSIQFHVLFDRNDLVAKHIVRWCGTGP